MNNHRLINLIVFVYIILISAHNNTLPSSRLSTSHIATEISCLEKNFIDDMRAGNMAARLGVIDRPSLLPLRIGVLLSSVGILLTSQYALKRGILRRARHNNVLS